MNQKGFTLIELLVVIAIIGVLATIIVSSLTSSKNRGNDAKTKTQLVSIRSQAEIFFSNQNPNGYGATVNACTGVGSLFEDTNITAILNAIPTAATKTCRANSSAYAVSASLASFSPTQYWCVDSRGASRNIGTTDLALNQTSCP